jgi:hypothetical protein
MGQKRHAYGVSVGKREGKMQLGRPGRRWEDSNKMDVKK